MRRVRTKLLTVVTVAALSLSLNGLATTARAATAVPNRSPITPAVAIAFVETAVEIAILGALDGISAGADIEELAFIVLLDAANDQDQDLQDILDGIQAQTKSKTALRILSADIARLEAALAAANGAVGCTAPCPTGSPTGTDN